MKETADGLKEANGLKEKEDLKGNPASGQDLDVEEAIRILQDVSPDRKTFEIVLNHAEAVRKVAVRIADAINRNSGSTGAHADMKTVKIGALLHDIGRFRHPPGPGSVLHGIAGAEMLRGIAERETDAKRKAALEKYARIAERHLGAGITKEDIEEQNLPLPKKDYLPETLEEKIIAYADNLIAGTEEKDFDYVVRRFRKELNEKVVERFVRLHNELSALMKKQ
ncbi:HD domain-containing protein [Candidatus Woesearchaeota archaeon]|nr:MAG: HD domain-containing protein [Candidatus Woesearchaeota archaeon]